MKVLIINSKGHWLNGWAINPVKLQYIINSLHKSGFKVRSVQVDTVYELQEILDTITPDTLVWTNAYWVNTGKNEVEWLNTYLEKRNLPLIGQSQKTLFSLLKKDVCQSKLNKAGIPVPPFVVIHKNQINEIEKNIFDRGLEFPLVVKPTNESRSFGIKIVTNPAEATEYVGDILKKYPKGHAIFEEFLQTDDICCGYIQLNGKSMILPSFQVIKGMNCENEIYGEKHYLLPPSDITHICINDESILTQLKENILVIAELFEITSFARVDGRLNESGVLNYFDVNAMPGLNYPISAIIQQCFAHFPRYNQEYVFECLINTIVLDKLLKYNFTYPKALDEHNLFNLESQTIIKPLSTKSNYTS